mgnify:CR=1 FL=1
MKLMNHIEGKERIKLHICTLKLMTQVNKNHKVNKKKKNKLELLLVIPNVNLHIRDRLRIILN